MEDGEGLTGGVPYFPVNSVGYVPTLDQTKSLDLDLALLINGAPDSSPVNLTHWVLSVLLHLSVLCLSIVKMYFGEYMYCPKTYTE